MEVQLPEIIDRISIIRLKIEKARDYKIKEGYEKELEVYEKALKEFEEKGIEIKDEWLKELYKVNSNQWNLESKMNIERKTENLKEMGKIYIELQISNKKRVAVKNEIVEQTGSGFRDIKIN